MTVVIVESAVVEDEVSLWHGVTLGSTLAEVGHDLLLFGWREFHACQQDWL